MGPAEEPPPELLELLAAVHARATAAWPSVVLPPEALADELARRLEGAPEAAGALARLNIEEVVLAVACARGDAAALGIFEARYVPDIRATLARVGLHGSVLDE